MWDLVLTVRQQLQWEFSNACVVKKTTTTIGSQRWHQRLEKEKLSEQVLFRTQYVLPPQVSTTWWRRCRWTSMSHPCLRWAGQWLSKKYYYNILIMFCLFWNASLKLTCFQTLSWLDEGKLNQLHRLEIKICKAGFFHLCYLQGGGEVCSCASGWQWHLLLATKHHPPVQDCVRHL